MSSRSTMPLHRIPDKIKSVAAGECYCSLEFFPPKTQQGLVNLRARIERMARALRPLFVSVTWGAGGSTSSRSLELARLCQQELGLTTCLHLTCTNMSRAMIDSALRQAHDAGVRNILALRGDPPLEPAAEAEGASASDVCFAQAADLVRYIRKQYGSEFAVGVAGYPEGHYERGSELGEPSAERDIPFLVEKVEAGADFIVTQLFYEPEVFLRYQDRLRTAEHGSGLLRHIPIIPGLMPIQSYKITHRISKLSSVSVPASLDERLRVIKEDDEAVRAAGVEVLTELVAAVKAGKQSPTPTCFHFYTLNLEKVVSHLATVCGLIPPATPVPVPTIVEPAGEDGSGAGAGAVLSTQTDALAISQGEGAAGRAANWDDFPNGRWGDPRSPAYGEIDGYGVTLPVPRPQVAAVWGAPETAADVTGLFGRFIDGRVRSLPWSDDGDSGPSGETALIAGPLRALIERGWWTVASQPAVDGADSRDGVVGWGPAGGTVFQKAFVEMFVPAADWDRLRAVLDRESGPSGISYLAALAPCRAGEVADLAVTADLAENGDNAVTWGIFPGKDGVVTSTVISPTSFSAWVAEAYEIWGVWQNSYPAGSRSHELLGQLRASQILVCVAHHDYKATNALWEILSEASRQ